MFLFVDENLQTDSATEEITRTPPRLRLFPPVREFVEMADRILAHLRVKGATPMETAVRQAAEQLEQNELGLRHLEIRQRQDLAMAPPLNESLNRDEYTRECWNIIRFYESVFGSAAGGGSSEPA